MHATSYFVTYSLWRNVNLERFDFVIWPGSSWYRIETSIRFVHGISGKFWPGWVDRHIWSGAIVCGYRFSMRQSSLKVIKVSTFRCHCGLWVVFEWRSLRLRLAIVFEGSTESAARKDNHETLKHASSFDADSFCDGICWLFVIRLEASLWKRGINVD